ncbi:sugar transferase [Streptomyces sp. NBC_00102]|uniref:sugar transferase n=1 Tax=Streptomyces sp. NBC_00102 TaxID=2975652 RepID=UPI00225743C4|nr:sugar transferase [Streptomyces sp. NBC_00102]MCX5398557.1 sugar transferase [Streptomyces sp. NBC_00102]
MDPPSRPRHVPPPGGVRGVRTPAPVPVRPPAPPLPLDGGAKRLLDVTLGLALLLLAAPVLLCAALALAVRHGPGRVIDRSPRAGLGGRTFVLRSLRTRWLRLDAVSRLAHVVRGELSLVGPAPLAPDDPRLLDGGPRRWRLELRPGLTGLAQVRARSGMPWDEAALLDLHYAQTLALSRTQTQRIRLDLAILAESVHTPVRATLRGPTRRAKGSLSDTDHRLPGYSPLE